MGKTQEIVVVMTPGEFAQMIEDYEGLFFECTYVCQEDDDFNEKGELCKYHKERGGDVQTLTKEMVLSLLRDKEVRGSCNYCGTPFKFVIKD